MLTDGRISKMFVSLDRMFKLIQMCHALVRLDLGFKMPENDDTFFACCNDWEKKQGE